MRGFSPRRWQDPLPDSLRFVGYVRMSVDEEFFRQRDLDLGRGIDDGILIMGASFVVTGGPSACIARAVYGPSNIWVILAEEGDCQMSVDGVIRALQPNSDWEIVDETAWEEK